MKDVELFRPRPPRAELRDLEGLTLIVPRKIDVHREFFYVQEIWRPACKFHALIGSRRKWLDAMELLYEYEGVIFNRNRTPWQVPLICEVFEPSVTKRRKIPADERENDMRWMGDFLKSAPCGKKPKSFARKTDRLVLIYLYCKLRRIEEGSFSV